MTKRGTPRPRAKRTVRRKPRKKPPAKKPTIKKATRARLISRTFLTAVVMACAQALNKFAPGEQTWYATGVIGIVATGMLGWFAADEKTRT